MTLKAHLNSAIVRLGRIYDKDYVGILMYLRIVDAHQGWFRRQHVATKPTGLEQYPKKFNPKGLAKAITSVSERNQRVKQLLRLRNVNVAHTGTNFVLSDGAKDRAKVTYRIVESLLRRSIRLLNLYSNQYDRNTYSTGLSGIDDFQFVIEAIEERFNHLRQTE